MEPHPRRRTSLVLVWVLVTLAAFAVVTLLVSRYPENTPDVTVLRWAMSWDGSGLRSFMESISWITDLWPRLVPAVLAVLVLFLLGHRVVALSISFTFVIILAPIEILDWASGVAVGRFRPNGAPFRAVPSGHVLGTVVMFGFGDPAHRGWAFPGDPRCALADGRGRRLQQGLVHTRLDQTL